MKRNKKINPLPEKYSILYGLFGFPVFVVVMSYLHAHCNSFIVYAFMMLWLVIPVLIVTVNWGYIGQELRSGRKPYDSWNQKKDFRNMHYPAWIRLFIIFVCGSVSTLFIKCILNLNIFD